MANGTMIFRQWPQIVGIEDPPKSQTRRGLPDDKDDLIDHGVRIGYDLDHDGRITIWLKSKAGDWRAKWWVGQKLTIMSGRGKPAIWRYPWESWNGSGWDRHWHYEIGREDVPMAWERCIVTITALNVERVQDITVGDEIAEGVKTFGGYRELFQSINGPKSWDANPRVAVITFRYDS